LLGWLAGLGWFTQHGELAATQSVSMLLIEEPALRDALLRHLGEITGTDLSAVRLFQAELVQDDLARPDLVGWDDRGQPLVVVEAKFGATLTPAQIRAYMTHQIAKMDAGTRGVLTVLVPSYRRPEAEAVLSTVGGDRDEPTAVNPSVSASVLTWDELLGVLEGTAAKVAADDRDAVMCDLRQLRALCNTMVGLDIPPLGPVAAGDGAWQDRQSDLKRVVDEASAKLHEARLAPLGVERWPGFDYYRRYLPPKRLGGGQCSVGVAGGLPGTPFWLRYHRETPNFPIFADRIMASRFAAVAGNIGGHLWLPLRVSADRSGATMIGELIKEIEAIRAVAEGPELPGGPIGQWSSAIHLCAGHREGT
jgi:hypothetical protein